MFQRKHNKSNRSTIGSIQKKCPFVLIPSPIFLSMSIGFFAASGTESYKNKYYTNLCRGSTRENRGMRFFFVFFIFLNPLPPSLLIPLSPQKQEEKKKKKYSQKIHPPLISLDTNSPSSSLTHPSSLPLVQPKSHVSSSLASRTNSSSYYSSSPPVICTLYLAKGTH